MLIRVNLVHAQFLQQIQMKAIEGGLDAMASFMAPVDSN